eukprot:TRINITY_DN57450_c1_g1_i2.p1 TRINITY_DN57450_c1_g1~~TRINITY_DN57450_c1_g1_i2.p1  ORF type:complete len:502 (+),score=270.42 TRINITY_DN57450_c1_g1_i2:409-1914(+)
MNDYRFIKNLGQPGNFGKAMEVEELNPADPSKPQRFAVKVIHKSRFAKRGREYRQRIFNDFRNEVNILSRMEHPNVIKFHKVYEDAQKFYIVMEKCAGGELFDRISAKGKFTEKDAAIVLRQIVSGVQYLHKNKVAHCDLKPDNFLFVTSAQDAQLKIIDFGMSKFARRRLYFNSFCGTPYYVAPEVLDHHYTMACDMWSVGVVMFVILHGYPPFYADPKRYGEWTDQKIFAKIKRGFINEERAGYGPWFPKTMPISASARDLIAKLLNPDAAQRLTAQEALDHPWLTGDKASADSLPTSVLKSLLEFNQSTRFKHGLLHMLAQRLSDDEAKELRKTFQTMDLDGDGSITVEELEVALRKLSMPDTDVASLMSTLDIDGDGKLSYEELIFTVLQRKLVAKEERIWQVFCEIDKNKDGLLEPAEIASAFGQDDAEKVKALIAELDRDSNGRIDYDEFLSMFFKELNSEDALKKMPSMDTLIAEAIDETNNNNSNSDNNANKE